ncbi:unnamed protein product [Dovyalis caffra]|uniref:Polygalacturonase n=1 Tax=Dovyalis caffra TaxID=77055 RepID=A0AAV1SCJ2_9ROSI|nr:unnamed protein product [Dovyalis caffra]
MMAAGVANFLFLLLLVTQVQGKIFDVKAYGAKANGMTDDSKAINSAWKDACVAKEASTVVIAKGNYMVGPLNFKGPCTAPVTVQVQGTLKAPADPRQLHGEWVVFRNVEQLTVSGDGIFDGQGPTAWSVNNCAKTGKCNSLPTVKEIELEWEG